jgi:putative phage-type endonuclease
VDVQQRTAEWKQQRLGKATASKISDIVAKTKTGWGASRANYAAQIIAERLTGIPQESYTNAAMQRGTETETEARENYSMLNGVTIEECGFIDHPVIKNTGASPDGIIGLDGLLEIKCPNTATHLETILGEPIDKKYLYQMQWQMCCANRRWCDFVSFDPRLPFELQMKVIRVNRDDELLASLEKDVTEFLAEIDAKIIKLKALV